MQIFYNALRRNKQHGCFFPLSSLLFYVTQIYCIQIVWWQGTIWGKWHILSPILLDSKCFIPSLVSTGALLAVQCVYTTANRIVPTADGFVAITKVGYIIRKKFHCPKTTPPRYNPLQNIVATGTVKSGKKDKENSSKQQYNQGNSSGSLIHTSKLSQICLVM